VAQPIRASTTRTQPWLTRSLPIWWSCQPPHG